MKPCCKAESRWKMWRDENAAYRGRDTASDPWVKKQITRARRRHDALIVQRELGK